MVHDGIKPAIFVSEFELLRIFWKFRPEQNKLPDYSGIVPANLISGPATPNFKNSLNF
jgi:hypothetical protein